MCESCLLMQPELMKAGSEEIVNAKATGDEELLFQGHLKLALADTFLAGYCFHDSGLLHEMHEKIGELHEEAA